MRGLECAARGVLQRWGKEQIVGEYTVVIGSSHNVIVPAAAMCERRVEDGHETRWQAGSSEV